MSRRLKLYIKCENQTMARDQYLEWCGVLHEHLGNNARCYTPERKIETPYAILYFDTDIHNPTSKKTICLSDTPETEETILQYALGEEIIF